MKKISKVLVAVLVMSLIVAFASVSVIAAESASVSVKTAPEKTVYYEGVDTYEGELLCDPTGMVLTVTNPDGTTVDVTAEDALIDMYVENYVIGENDAVVSYMDEEGNELTTTVKVTVKENPVASVKITKMPAKTEYDMDKDVLTKDNFDLDKLYESDPESMDAILEDLGMTYDEFKEMYENSEMKDLMLDILFSEYSEILMVDTTGMEIEVTFKDGTTQTITDESAYVTYNGAEIPVMVGQKSGKITEGANTLYVDVAGVTADFDVTVKKSASADKPNAEKPADAQKPAASNNKNPEIPNTDGGVSLVATAVIALVSGCGIALVPSKKKEQF